MWQEWCIQMSLLKLWWPLEHSCSPTWKFWSASCTGARRKYRYLWSSAFCKRGGAWATVGPHFTDRDTDGAASIWKYLSNVLSHIVICTQDRQLHWLSTANVYQFSSVAQSCLALCDSMDYTMPGLPVHHQLPGACSNSCPSSQWYHPNISSSVIPFSPCLQSFLASGSFQMSQFFVSGSQSIRCFSFSPSNEYSGLISFRIDWLDLLAVQGTLRSPLQHHSSKASILWCSAFFMSNSHIHERGTHIHMATGKTTALTR